jgi:hypothetical protein
MFWLTPFVQLTVQHDGLSHQKGRTAAPYGLPVPTISLQTPASIMCSDRCGNDANNVGRSCQTNAWLISIWYLPNSGYRHRPFKPTYSGINWLRMYLLATRSCSNAGFCPIGSDLATFHPEKLIVVLLMQQPTLLLLWLFSLQLASPYAASNAFFKAKLLNNIIAPANQLAIRSPCSSATANTRGMRLLVTYGHPVNRHR